MPSKPYNKAQKDRAKEIRKPSNPTNKAQKDRAKEIRKSAQHTKDGIIKTTTTEKEFGETYVQQGTLQQLNEFYQGSQILQIAKKRALKTKDYD